MLWMHFTKSWKTYEAHLAQVMPDVLPAIIDYLSKKIGSRESYGVTRNVLFYNNH